MKRFSPFNTDPLFDHRKLRPEGPRLPLECSRLKSCHCIEPNTVGLFPLMVKLSASSVSFLAMLFVKNVGKVQNIYFLILPTFSVCFILGVSNLPGSTTRMWVAGLACGLDQDHTRARAQGWSSRVLNTAHTAQ